MKGKKILFYSLILSLLSTVAFGVVFGFKTNDNSIKYAKAESMVSEGFSEKYEGDIIFSVEKVYFADDQSVKLSYNGYDFESIQNEDNQTSYFGAYRLFDDRGANNNKYVVGKGDYVMVDDMTTKEAKDVDLTNGDVTIKEGIMVTLGGYFYDNGVIKTTSHTYKTNSNGELVRDDNGNLIDVYDGANLELVSIQASLNGKKLDLPTPRTYNSKYYDFVWFIPTDDTNSTEGHYEISIAYMKSRQDVLHQNFDFYYLYKSSYEKNQNINGQNYTPMPTFDTSSVLATNIGRQYEAFLDNDTNYPLLTFDYSRYNMSYTYTNGGVERQYALEYDGVNLLLHTTLYGITTTRPYPIPAHFGNTIVSIMFADAGEYNFSYEYVYNYKGERKEIDNLTIDPMKLTIYGYQLKYSKTDTLGVDMNRLEIASNGTMFILINGFTDGEDVTGTSAGINYELVEIDKKTGTIENRYNAELSATELGTTELKNIEETKLEAISYQTTNQGGLWLTLNDKYELGDSYYYYSSSPITSEFITCDLKEFTKVTTFTKTGYYLVQVTYKYDEADPPAYKTQWFAFRITSSTPKMYMYTTEQTEFKNDGPDDKTSFYSHQYTNKNVYINWTEPNTFESKIIATIYTAKAANTYPTEDELKNVALGGINSNIKKSAYTKNNIITANGSYLLVLQLENTLTRTYSYFTIDKENISGLEVYEVATTLLDGRAIYSIKRIERDGNLQYVTHTNKTILDTDITLGWADKKSGANISASYKFAPFVKNSTAIEINDRSITSTIGGQTKLYMLNDYSIGTMSQSISISKPTSSNLDVDSVLTNQGIYVFTLEDEAGNKLEYIVIIDRTESYIKAWYYDDEGNYNEYYNGDTVNNEVNLEWGTHKAINIKDIATNNLTLDNLIYGREMDNYYQEGNSNISYFGDMFYGSDKGMLLTVANTKTEIRLLQDSNKNTYIITASGTRLTKYPNGQTVEGWDETAYLLFDENKASSMGMTIKVDSKELHYYNVNVVGQNQIENTNRSDIKVVITPDKAKGQVFSSASADSGVYETRVNTKDSNVESMLADKKYNLAQASDDSVFVFECIPEDTTFKVTEIKYEYYQLMSQSSLNDLTADNIKDYPFYPYTYVSTDYILRTGADVEPVVDYVTLTRQNSAGESETVIRSNPINVGYESYYDDKGGLVSSRVTQTGLYIITRTIQQEGAAGAQQWAYAFFVDRNQIIGYSLSSSNEKLVGQFIHANMLDAEFDNFAKQGLPTKEQEYVTGKKDDNGENIIDYISYKVYLETNKLPTQIKVPTGKYVSGNINKEILKTSVENLKLKLSVYFYDYYGLLGDGDHAYKFIRLMHNVDGEYVDDNGYILFNFANNNAGEVAMYRKALAHNGGDGKLSLPGEYIFVVSDTVGTTYDNNNNITDCNKFTFGIKLTNVKPTTDVYAYASMNGYTSDKKYSQDYTLYTNQQFVDFEIPKVKSGSYNAQLDFNNFEILRADKNGNTSVWLRKRNGIISSAGIITNDSVITTLEDRYVIHLDTGLVLDENGNIQSYQEYAYSITIQYILPNNGEAHYTYKDLDNNGNITGTHSFYSSTYNVHIDRTPNATNLNNILSSQKTYFEEYMGSVVNGNELTTGKLNVEKSYRSNITTSDYYALVNNMYYQLVDKSNPSQTSQGVYAINVNQNTPFNREGLARVYYRSLNFSSNAAKKTRMGLLPICDTYFENSSGYEIFSETLTTYLAESTTNSSTYWDVVAQKDGNEEYGSGYYEIVEVDLAGNLTQYIVYFESSNKLNVDMQVKGKSVENESVTPTLTFKQKGASAEEDNTINDITFIGIEDVVAINNIASESHPYYANVKVYDGGGVILTSIYVNSTITATYLSEQIKEVIDTDGNYTIQITDTYNNTYYVYINNYTNTNYRLTTSALVVKTDNVGNKYIQVGLANTQMNESANLYCFVKEITFSYDSTSVTYVGNLDVLNAGVLKLSGLNSSEVFLSGNDIIYLADNKQYLVTLTDSFGKSDYYMIISTDEGYQSYSIAPTTNYYQNNNITYTAGDVVINYNSAFYEAQIIYQDENGEEIIDSAQTEGWNSSSSDAKGFTHLTLAAYKPTSANDVGMLRRFRVVLKLRGVNASSYEYEVWIDTRFTVFNITNQNLEDRQANVLATIRTGTANINDFTTDELSDTSLYGELLTETVNISWTKLDNGYFNYQYKLFEFENNYTANELEADDKYTIVPKEDTTGKYILKVTVTDKNGQWIATRIFAINMSTSISGLYKVMDDDKEVSHSSITNLEEILITFGLLTTTNTNINNISVNELSSNMAADLGFEGEYAVNDMKDVFTSFGKNTAIPMYISINDLTLHSNSDNGVQANCYEYNGTSTIKLYNITRSNYRTFAIIMKVNKVDYNSDILSGDNFALRTREDANEDKLLSKGNSFIKYDDKAEYYKLYFNSFNKNMGDNLLEKHNKIIIDVYYNGEFASRVIGGQESRTIIEFKNAGIYKLEVKDVAGNVQNFGAGSSRTNYFTLTIMKGILFSINGEAPIKYAYYSDKVTLTINNTNPSTNTYNYDFNSIQLHAYLNNSMNEYKGYTRNSYTYTFTEYGTYLIKMSAKLLSTGETVTGDMVFTIINPAEARVALDFTAIYGYDIISVTDMGRTVEKDVTERFLNLLSDKANQDSNVYTKLITYERIVEEFGITQGKMKFKVVYEANDDELLPARRADFTFTINHEVPTIEASIGAGKKTTSPVTLKFNSAIIYSQMGECNLVINDEVVLRIDENSANGITQLQIKNAGKYYVKIVTDSGYVATSFNFTIKEKLNTVSIILIVIISAIVIGLVATFIWLRTRMKVR